MYSLLQDMQDHKPQKSDFLEYLQWHTDCVTSFSQWIWNVQTVNTEIQSGNTVKINVVKWTSLSDFLIYQYLLLEQ